jgi:two-component system chemotaxis response regulator CheY
LSLTGHTPTEIPIFRGAKVVHKVLVVDDSPSMRQHARLLLEGAGFEVVDARNGREGVEAARRHPIDVIVVEVNMPVMNGLQMVTEIRKMPEYRRTPIFVLSAESSAETILRGKAAGATAWMVKPFKGDVLIPALRRVLSP